jgi:hypothetical protein
MNEVNLAGEMVKVVLGKRGFTLYQVKIGELKDRESPFGFFHVKNGILVYYLSEDNWLVHLEYKKDIKKKYNHNFKSFEEVLKFLDEVEHG